MIKKISYFCLYLIFLKPLLFANPISGIQREDFFTKKIDLWKRLFDEFDTDKMGARSHFNDDGTVTFYDPAVRGYIQEGEILVLFSVEADKDMLCKWLVSSSSLASQLSLNEIKAHGPYKSTLSTSEIYSQNYLAGVNEEMSAYTFRSYNQRISSITCQLSKLNPPVSHSYQEAIESEDQKTIRIVKPRFRYQGKERRIDAKTDENVICHHYGYQKGFVDKSLVKRKTGFRYNRNLVKLDQSRLCSSFKSHRSLEYVREISCYRD